MDLKDQISDSITFIRKKTKFEPEIGIILGSGLGSFTDIINAETIIKTSDIPHYPVSTAPGHEGALYFGELNSTKIMAVKGRVHYYEGYPMQKVAYSVNLMAALGIRYLIVTNAAGSVNSYFVPGDLMLITDHISFYFDNPLIGIPVDDESQRFVNMYPAYDVELNKVALNTANRIGINLKTGVLFASTGPCYETAAEVAMIKIIGGDAVTMSTIPEVIVANQYHIRVIGISCITNYATGITDKKLVHEDVTANADKIKEKFMRLVNAIIVRINQLPDERTE